MEYDKRIKQKLFRFVCEGVEATFVETTFNLRPREIMGRGQPSKVLGAQIWSGAHFRERYSMKN